MFSVNYISKSVDRITDLGKLTEALGGGALQQVIDGGTDNGPRAGGINGEAADLHTMTTSDILDKRGLAHNLHQLLAGIPLVEEVTDFTGGHLLLEGDADGVL